MRLNYSEAILFNFVASNLRSRTIFRGLNRKKSRLVFTRVCEDAEARDQPSIWSRSLVLLRRKVNVSR